MYFYKFRVFYDEVDDFIRDIEILSTDTFESFHAILYSSIGLLGNELASFSLCDTKWNKQKEITLIDMGDDSVTGEPEYDDEDGFTTKSNLPKFVMKEAVLKDFISDPHQHLIYEYDFLHPKIFYIELLKIAPVEKGAQYPKCSFRSKELPKDAKQPLIPNPEDDFSEEDFHDEEDFEDGYNDEDHLDLGNIDEYREF